MQTENTTKKCKCMEENNPRQIPIEHGDLSEIARILNVSHAHVSRWYHGKNVHPPKLHDEMLRELLKIHGDRMKIRAEIEKMKKAQGL
jgi:DNA-binding transcriptional regulator YiaG